MVARPRRTGHHGTHVVRAISEDQAPSVR